jgi:DNA-binding beta-propeller fold protein YncE
VNETTNEVYLVQTGDYGYHRLWILDADTWTWSWIDFTSLNAYFPQHVAVSEAENRVFVKLIGIPGQAEPGIYVQDRDDGRFAFIGNDDYGEMVVNELSGRLFSGIEVGQNAAVIQVATNTLFNVPLNALEGGAVAVNVRRSTDHAFIADQGHVALIDGASRTTRLFPVTNSPTGGILVQDVAVNQNTGWVYVIPDDDLPFIVAVSDLPAGPLQ